MSETFPHRVERLEHEPALPSPEHHLELPEHAEAPHAGHDPENAAAAARAELAGLNNETQPSPLDRLKAAENTPQGPSAHIVSHEMRKHTEDRELLQLQRREKPAVRQFSKLVHRPAVRTVSEAAGKTISRPTGLLGGGLTALAGTTIYLYLAKHIGFTYNYTVFLALFVAGFAVGLAIEVAVHRLSTRHMLD